MSFRCSTAAVHCISQRRWESCQLALSCLTASGGHLGRHEDPGIARFSHKIILVFMTVCLWWALLRGTSSAKRREIKIIVKPKTIKINPRLRREMHTFHPRLDMTHQYSPLHAAQRAAPALPSLLLQPLHCSLTNHVKSQIYSYITFPAHSWAYFT